MAAVGPGESGETTGIWAVSILGGAPRKLCNDAGRASVSPEDTRIAYIGGRAESQIWVMRADGESAAKVLQGAPGERFLEVHWSPDGKRVAVLSLRTLGDESKEVVETVAVEGGNSILILSVRGLRSFCWSSKGQIIYSKEEEPPNDRDTNLWEVPVNRAGTKATGSPQRITSWAGLSLSDLSVSDDGSHLAFVNAGMQTDTYVAALEGKSGMETPRRFTLEGRDNVPSAWTPDGGALFFFSDRNGKSNIFWQGLQQRSARDFFWGPGEQTQPQLSPDGSSVLYWEASGKQSGAAERARLLRVPVSGGAPEMVAEASHGAAIHCVHGNPMCVLSELDKPNGELVFTGLDPTRGRKAELVRLAADMTGQPAWDLSPDGTTIAIVGLDDHKDTIRVVELDNGSSRLIHIGHSERLSGITWSADGNGWIVTSSSILGATLLEITSSGEISELWRTTSTLGAPLASPDGKNLAFTVSTYNSNAWMIQSF